jgi:hypothetical protein
MAAGDRFGFSYMTNGQEVGIGSALTVPLSFRPCRVDVFNTTTNTNYTWIDPHGAAGATKTLDSGAGVTDISTVTSNGITVGSAGFILGTGVQTTSDVVYWSAFHP